LICDFFPCSISLLSLLVVRAFLLRNISTVFQPKLFFILPYIISHLIFKSKNNVEQMACVYNFHCFHYSCLPFFRVAWSFHVYLTSMVKTSVFVFTISIFIFFFFKKRSVFPSIIVH